ncbi:MAG: DUF2974 domain-containing protein, partial [Eggerthellaceae bacterium]|nr:DUF2974 domain-containing protein [Eggerthellaceae bacterium]
PESSVIGMLFGRGVERRVVRSSGASLAQHNLFLWEVEGPRFVAADAMTGSSEYFARVLDEWLRASTDDERKSFVDALFKLVNASGATRTGELAATMAKNLPSVFKAGNQYTDAEKAALKSFGSSFAKESGEMLNEAFGDKLGPLMAGLGITMPQA